MNLKFNRRSILLGAATLALTPIIARAAEKPPAFAQDVANLGAPDTVLESKITGLANEAGLAHVGFAAVDIVKGRTAFVRGGELFKMQGVSKLPIAVAILRRVQQGVAHLCWLFERWVIIQTVINGTARAVRVAADRLRRVQTGRLTGYVTTFVLGAVAVIGAVLYAVLG